MNVRAFVIACTVLVSFPASAQMRRDTAGVALPPIALGSIGSALSVAVNPADLAFLPAWSVAYVHAEAPSNVALSGQGDGLYAAVPLAFGVSMGASVESVRPTAASAFGPSFGIGSLSLAFRPIPHFGLGSTLRFSIAPPGSPVIGVTTLDIAAAWRPLDIVSLSLIARDFTGPTLSLAPGTTFSVPRSFFLATTLRPLSTDAWQIDLSGGIDTELQASGRVQTDIAIPGFGRASASFEIGRHRTWSEAESVQWTAIGGVEMQWENFMLGGGAIGSSAFPSDAAAGYVVARIEGAQRAGIPRDGYVIDLAVRGAMDERRWIAFALSLERAKKDDRVRGVLFRPRGTGIGLADAQEIRLLFSELRRAGKKVLCHLEAATGAELYACAAADRTLIDPAGGVRLVGPSAEVIHVAGTLDQLGIRADFVRIGPWKSAPEQFTDRHMSGPARASREAILDTVYGRFTDDLARDRNVGPEEIRALVDRGPFLAEEAVASGLVSSTADEHELPEALADLFGGAIPHRANFASDAPVRWGQPARIGVVVIEGTMVEGDDVDIPFVGVHMSGGRSTVRAIESLASDPSVAAIVVRIDSPGGSALASDQIWRALRRAREAKPVIASFGSMAASGGYYAGSAASEIWADPATVTGSIGIFYGKVDVAGLADRIGVDVDLVGRGAHANTESIFRPYTDEERQMLRDKIGVFYRLFVSRVSEGRGLSEAQVDALGQGRVWTGDAALHVGLVDHLGGFASALARARALGHVPSDAGVVVLPRRPSNLLEMLVGQLGDGVRADQGASLDPAETQGLEGDVPEALLRALGSVAAWVRMDGVSPQALIEDLVRIE